MPLRLKRRDSFGLWRNRSLYVNQVAISACSTVIAGRIASLDSVDSVDCHQYADNAVSKHVEIPNQNDQVVAHCLAQTAAWPRAGRVVMLMVG
jgi:hypothetical protein